MDSARCSSCRGPAGRCPRTARPWPGPSWTTSCARTALDAGARALPPAKAVDVVRDGERVRGVVFAVDGGRREVRCDRLVIADGVRSPLGRVLGRKWHRDTVYGVAARAYLDSGPGRPVDLLPPRAARPRRGAAVGLRLDLPAGRRTGEPRRRNPGDGQAAGQRVAASTAGVLRRSAAGGVAARARHSHADLRPAAHGRGGERCRRAQLGADRRRRGLRQSAERRGNRLRAGVRADWWPTCCPTGPTWVSAGPRCSGRTTGRRSRSPVGWPD